MRITATVSLLLTLSTFGNGICVAQSHAILTPVSPATTVATQRRINDWAAALEQARYSLVEETGFRQPTETLHPYLYRIAQPFSSESPEQYTVRINGYVDVFTQASNATLTARRMPMLRDSSAANQKIWQRAVRSISLLPGRIHKMRSVWLRARRLMLHGITVGKQNTKPFADSVSVAAIGSELEQTLGVVLEARSALRDARP